MSPSGKAPDFDSGIRRFKSCHPSQTLRGSISLSYDPLAQLAEQLPFKQWVRSSNLRRVTKKEDTPPGYPLFSCPRDSKTINATPRWGVAATSANTGGYYNFCLQAKMQTNTRLRCPAAAAPDKAGLHLADRGAHCAWASSATGSAQARGQRVTSRREWIHPFRGTHKCVPYIPCRYLS